jgi:PIN domain nuclease of toxin-antitoxin system
LRFLLDTHVWLWLLESPERVAPDVRERLAQASDLVLSAASVWELANKVGLGKLAVSRGVEFLREELIREARAQELPVRADHALAAARLPAIHKDPFDRVLIAQSSVEGLCLVTADVVVRQYGTQTLWAV